MSKAESFESSRTVRAEGNSVAASDHSGHPLQTEGEPSRSAMRRKVVASLLWQGSASLVGQAISWLVTLIVIRLLSPSDYGLVAMASLSISFLMLVGDLGVGAVVVPNPAFPPPQLPAP